MRQQSPHQPRRSGREPVGATDVVRIIGTGLISMGMGLLVFVAITMIWGDPFTRFQAEADQDSLERQIERVEAEFGTSDSVAAQAIPPDPALTRRTARRFRRSVEAHAALGEIRIPRIGLTKVVVNGTGVEDLKKGPGVYPEAALPGMGAPVAVAGHRTTYGAPFMNVDKLRMGDEIVLDMPYGVFTYRVVRTEIIEPDDWTVIDRGRAWPRQQAQRILRGAACMPDDSWTRAKLPRLDNCEHLVLTACHPKYSAAQRIAVFAILASVELRTAEGA